MPLSNASYLPHIANLFGTIFIAFGVNAIVRPTTALTFFEYYSPPSNATDGAMVDSLMAIYGVRDIFMGAAIYAASFTGTKKSLGWTLILASLVAYADGYITLQAHGTGQWGHWGYAPFLTGLGCVLLGACD